MAGAPKKGKGKTHSGMRIEHGVWVRNKPTYSNSPAGDKLSNSQARGCLFEDS